MTTTEPHDQRAGADGRLNSWKEIASFFGKDERTVKRWEKARGLPVRRVPGGLRNSVFAYTGELEQWLSRGDTPTVVDPPSTSRAAIVQLPRPRRNVLRWLVPMLAVLGIAAGAAYLTSTRSPPGTPVSQTGHVAPIEARDLVLSGTFNWVKRTEEGLKQAVADFSSAIEIDPEYGAAYAGLAHAYNLLSQYSLMPAAEAYPKAKAAAERAIALDPGLAEGYAALAFNEFYWSRHFELSAELFEKAIALDPNSPHANHWYALTAMHTGSFEKPLIYIERALELSPESRAVRANKALILFHAGRVSEALAILTGLAQSDPDFLATSSYLATIYLDQRRYADFLREYTKAAEVQHNEARIAIAEAAQRGFAESGGTGLLSAMLAEQQRQFDLDHEPAYKLAVTSAMLGDTDAALAFLESSFSRSELDILGMRIDPAFRVLHDEPRFEALLVKVGLPPVT